MGQHSYKAYAALAGHCPNEVELVHSSGSCEDMSWMVNSGGEVLCVDMLSAVEESSRCQQACSRGCMLSLCHAGGGSLSGTCSVSWLHTGNIGLRIWQVPGQWSMCCSF